MGGKGEYAVFVGSLTVPLHNAWADAAIEYIKKNHSEMTLVGDRYGVAEDADKSRSTALDLISAHPNLKGFLAFGSQGPIGAGRAIEERRKTGEIFVLGPFSPGQGQKLIKADAISGGFMWNPKQAGEVFVTLADKLMSKPKSFRSTPLPRFGTSANFANYINWVTKKRSDFVGYSAGSPQPPSCSIMPNALRSGDTRV